MIFYDINNIDIKFLFDKAEMLDIDDDVYFSDKYKGFISNSSLKYINPDQEGSPYEYKYGNRSISTRSLLIGSIVHMNVLQNINPKSVFMDFPKGEKINLAIKDIVKNVKSGSTFDEALEITFKKRYYYATNFDVFKRNILKEKGYFDVLMDLDQDAYLLDFNESKIIDNCISSLSPYKYDLFFSKDKECKNEMTILCPIEISFKDNDKKIILNFKCKIDNFIIDDKNKTIILNDLKTTYHELIDFQNSIDTFHYKRQMALYLYVLSNFLKQDDRFKEYNLNANIVAVSTKTFESNLFQFSQEDIIEGTHEFINLIKRVGFHEAFGYDRLIDDL